MQKLRYLLLPGSKLENDKERKRLKKEHKSEHSPPQSNRALGQANKDFSFSYKNMKIQKAAFIAFPASDFEASLIFYRDLLDLPIIAEGTDAFSRFTHFDCGGFGIHLYERTKPFHHAHTGLQLYVEDVDAMYQELTSKGVVFNDFVRDEPWGGRVVTVRDPDGNLFDLLNADYEQKLRS